MWRTPKITIVTRTIIRATVKSSKNQIFALDYVCVLKNAAVAMCIHVQFMWCVSSAHIRQGERVKQKWRRWRRSVESGWWETEYKLIQSVCKFLQLLICTKRIFALFLDGSAFNATEIFRFYGTHICQPHTICKDLFPSLWLRSFSPRTSPRFSCRSAENFQFKYV